MSIRSIQILSVCLFLTSSLFAAAAGDYDTQDVSFNKPVRTPDGVLQPGKYTIRLEDRMADRAIVRITEPGGAEHYLLTVPSTTLQAASKGLIYFPGATGTAALKGWECGGCKRPLEFVYPKDDAVNLTAETGKPVLAYDASYDKLPADLSPSDRKVVTLWLLAPKTVTPQGKGEGLTAAKYSTPKALASAEALPTSMPKTGSLAFLEVIAGFLSFTAGAVVFLWRKVSALPLVWKMAGLTMVGGMVAGFALPIVSSYQTAKVYFPSPNQIAPANVLEVLADRDSEVERLKARNRRLEAMLAALRQRDAEQ